MWNFYLGPTEVNSATVPPSGPWGWRTQLWHWKGFDIEGLNLWVVAGAAAGAAAATPPPLPARSGECAGELIRSSELISNTIDQSTLPTRTHQIQQSGQKRSLPSVW